VAFSQNGGESWQMQDSPLPWRSQNSVMSPTGRLFIARLDVSGTTRRLRIASSDDLGQSWQSRIDQQINGVISSLANFDASAGGRLILSGFGNTVLVSMDDGESIHELSTPTFNAATIYASTFSDNESIAIGGSTDILLRGILNSVSSVAERYCDDQGAILPYKYHSIVEYDLHGRILGSYYSAQALTLIEFLERTRSSAHGVRLLHCTNNDGAQSLVSLIR
jgi:hypothetical protein